MKTIGIDVSKLTFDVWSEETGHEQFCNDVAGFKAFKKLLNKEDHCVMEAMLAVLLHYKPLSSNGSTGLYLNNV